MERLQKVLAQAGIASRRAAEQIILAGRVRVDGKVVRELGTQVDPRKSRVEVDGTKIVAEKLIYIVLHKPRGVVCTLSDPEGRPTIRELLKEAGARVVPVGRLDFHTSGALLCTNDGEFAQGLAHPKRAVPKVYVAKVKGTVDDDALPKLSERIEIDGRLTQPAQVKRLRYEGDKTWLEITLREGRNRQVRRLGEATGFPVMRLARISHAGVTSEDLRPGQWRPLTVDELVDLKKDYGVPKKVRAPHIDPEERKPQKGHRKTRPDVHGEAYKAPARGTRGAGRFARTDPRAEPTEGHSAWGEERGESTRGRGRGESPARGRGESPARGRGESPARGRGEGPARGRGEGPARGRGEGPARGRGESPARGRGEGPARGRGEGPARGRGEGPARGRGEGPARGRGEGPVRGRSEGPARGRGGESSAARPNERRTNASEGRRPASAGSASAPREVTGNRAEAKPPWRGNERPERAGGKGYGAPPVERKGAPKDGRVTERRGERVSAPRRGTSR